MKLEQLLDIFETEFPRMAAMSEDYIGEQVKIKEDVKKILVTLDITLDVISQAIKSNADLIVSHHPFFFGDKDELLKNDSFLKAKFELLKNNNIGVFAIHTNADFNSNSIAFVQGLALDLENLEQNNENLSVTGYLKDEQEWHSFLKHIKKVLELEQIEFRANFNTNESISKIIIASGAGGDQINYDSSDALYIIGEVKHHEWVKAAERNIRVLEISHFSEKIFKDMIELLLKNEDVEIIKSEEENGYKII